MSSAYVLLHLPSELARKALSLEVACDERCQGQFSPEYLRLLSPLPQGWGQDTAGMDAFYGSEDCRPFPLLRGWGRPVDTAEARCCCAALWGALLTSVTCVMRDNISAGA